MTKKHSTSSGTSADLVGDNTASSADQPADDAAKSSRLRKALSTPRAGRPIIAISAGTVLAAIVLGAIFGVIWGVLRPGQTVQYIEPNQFGVTAETIDAPFLALAWFTGLSVVLGILVAMIAFIRGREYRTVSMEIWVAVAALIGALVVIVLGQVVAGYRQPDLTNLKDGATLTVIPAFDTYVALLVAPLSAMIAYWVGMLFTDSEIAIDNHHRQVSVHEHIAKNSNNNESDDR